MKYLRLIGCCVAALAISQGAMAAKVYTWKDQNGVVHYGERPPKDVQAKLINARTGHSDPTPAQIAAALPAPESQPAVQADQQAQSFKDPDRCKIARENLEMLNTVALIKMPNADGVMAPLTEEGKSQQRLATQRVIDQACE